MLTLVVVAQSPCMGMKNNRCHRLDLSQDASASVVVLGSSFWAVPEVFPLGVLRLQSSAPG